MSNHMSMVTVSASKKPMAHKGKGGKKMLRHMTVTPMANGGATVEHHFMPSDDMMTPTPAPETHGFGKNKDVGKHVSAMLDGMPGGAAEAAGVDDGGTGAQ